MVYSNKELTSFDFVETLLFHAGRYWMEQIRTNQDEDAVLILIGE